MAKIIKGFLKQKCFWTQKLSGTNIYGEPNFAAAVEIRCRWITNGGWVSGLLGAGTGDAYDHIVFTADAVKAGDTLQYTDPETGEVFSGIVHKFTPIISAAGKEEGRICYV